jgi:PEP-CTERM motif
VSAKAAVSFTITTNPARFKWRSTRSRAGWQRVAVARSPRVGLFDLCADGGIGGLERRPRTRCRASAHVNERHQGKKAANRLPVSRHRHALPILPFLAVRERRDALVLAAAICRPIVFTLPGRYMGGGQSARTRRSKDFVKTLRLPAALAALTLTASTTCAAVIDLSNPLGPSGRYTSEAYYQGMLGGQPMTAAQQAYAGQEDQLRLQGFLSELGGDIALGQIFYHMAYGITPPRLRLHWTWLAREVTLALLPPRGLVTGASDFVDYYMGAGFLTTSGNAGITGIFPAIAVPEASTWVMMAIGFLGLGFMGWRSSRRAAAHAA